MRIGAHVQMCCVGNTLSGWYYHIDGHICTLCKQVCFADVSEIIIHKYGYYTDISNHCCQNIVS